MPLSDSFSLAAYGDVGGLGGYRYLALHHDESAQEIDIGLSGPLVGFSYKF